MYCFAFMQLIRQNRGGNGIFALLEGGKQKVGGKQIFEFLRGNFKGGGASGGDNPGGHYDKAST